MTYLDDDGNPLPPATPPAAPTPSESVAPHFEVVIESKTFEPPRDEDGAPCEGSGVWAVSVMIVSEQTGNRRCVERIAGPQDVSDGDLTAEISKRWGL